MNNTDTKVEKTESTNRVVTAICQKYLDELRVNTPEILSAAVTTGDGFSVAISTSTDVSADKLAAMTSSMHALGEAVVNEAKLRKCQNIVIEAESGKVLLFEIPNVEQGLVLNIIASNQAILGHLLWASKNCCGSISQKLQLQIKL